MAESRGWGRQCGDAKRPGHDDVPGQQFGDAIDWVIGDAAEHLVQIGFGIEPVELGRLDERVGRGGARAAGIGAELIMPGF